MPLHYRQELFVFLCEQEWFRPSVIWLSKCAFLVGHIISNSDLDIVDSYKYLGTTISNDCKLNMAHDSLLKSATSCDNTCNKIQIQFKFNSI